MRLEKSVQLFFELFSSRHPIKGIENATALIVVKERGGALVIIREADLETRFVVVFPLNEGGSADVADSFLLRLHRDDVVAGAAFRADAPGRNPADQLLIGAADVDLEIDFARNLFRNLVPSLRLGDRPRKAIEKIAIRAIGLGQALFDEGASELIAHEVAPINDRLDLLSEFASARHGLTEHVAGGNVRNVVVFGHPLRVRAFARTRGTH